MFSLTIQAGYEGSDIATRVSDYAVFSEIGRLIFQYILLKTCKM